MAMRSSAAALLALAAARARQSHYDFSTVGVSDAAVTCKANSRKQGELQKVLVQTFSILLHAGVRRNGSNGAKSSTGGLQ
jgi:hypothetical protein